MTQQEALVEQMAQRAESVQAVVSRIRNLHEAFRYAVSVTKSQGGSAIAAPALSVQQILFFEVICQESGITLIVDDLRDNLSSLHTGFTVANRGIAETGTLVLDSTAEDVRLATMLCQTHIAVLPRSRILPSMADLAVEMDRRLGSAPRYIAFITGPGRTAAIERVLTIGAQGPRELHVLVMEEEGI